MLLEERLNQELESLDDEERLAIYYRYWANMSISEISKLLHLSWNETDKLLTQTLKQLRQQLSSDEPIRDYLNSKIA